MDERITPTHPTVEKMKTWNKEEMLQWIQQRIPDLLKGNREQQLIDHRYFYCEFQSDVGSDIHIIGSYTCGFVCNAVAAELRAKEVDFADMDFLKSLPDYINIPCVTRFMMKQTILSSIVSSGLAIGENKHSDSRDKFFNQYQEWTKDLKEFDVVAQFGRITPNSPILVQHDQINQPIHSERYVHPSKVNQDIWKECQRAKENKTIQEAPEEPVGREE
ncbi:hypothetical protein V8E54_005311 [Elaphomyces granulatus]